MLRRAAALAVLCLTAAPAARAAGPPTLALSDVQPGMTCTVASVIQGTAISTFDARIDDVISGGADPSASRILLTVSGAAVEGTGIGSGFSGSPVTCPGPDGVPRIAGAISETIGAYGNRTVLATPIAPIIGEPVDPPGPSAVSGRAAAAALRGARPIEEPLTLGGLAPQVGRVFQQAAARAGRALVLAPAQAPQAAAPGPVLVPGAAVAVALATGDLTAGAIGTVAYTDGDVLWAFGHPFDAAGKRDLFLTGAYVYGVIGNPLATSDSSSYKLATPTAPLGTITQDGLSAIVGRVGPLPTRFPLTITTRDRDTGRLFALRSDLADERALGFPSGSSALTTVLPAGIAQGIYGTLNGSPVRQSADLCLRVSVRERRRPLGFCNTYVGGGGSADAIAGGPVVADAVAAAGLLDAYDRPLHITKVEAGVRVRRGLALATLTDAVGPPVVRRGTTVSVRVTADRSGGGTVQRTIRVPVPRGMPAGPRDLLLRGTDADVPPGGGGSGGGGETTIDLSGLFDSSSADPSPVLRTVGALADALAGLHRYDGVTARFVPPGANVPQDLPGGAEGVAQRGRRVFRDPQLRLAGRVRFAVVVR